MWLSLFMTHEKNNILRITKMLYAHNIVTKVIKRASDPDFFEVFVPQPEFREAQELMLEDELFN